jgi:tripartite-type tricarboxylate transporter receptor subunit TctC
MMPRFKKALKTITFFVLWGSATAVFAVDQPVYPNKPIKFIVPFAPGGNTDIAARIVATGLTEQLGQSVIVENKAGAGGGIGTDFVAKASPDGYTVLVGHIGALTINPAIYEKLPYDTMRDFEPVGLSVVTPLVLVTAPKTGIKSMDDLIRRAKSDPDKETFGTAGSGSAAHMASELFNLTANIKTTHIPYKGAGPATTALVSGEIDFSFSGLSPSLPFVKTGKLIALGVTSKKPVPQYPGVKTLDSMGLTDFEVVDWNGLLVPTGTPQSVIQKLNFELNKFLNLASTKVIMEQQGFEARPGSPEQFKSFIKTETDKWSRSAKLAKIKVE